MTKFWKYHGAGNDFIMLDNRAGIFDISDKEKIKLLCHRRFGVGADGIFLLENSDEYDFKMVFANNDGSMGSMCGNGGRCIVHFAYHVLGIVKNSEKIIFEAVDGVHEASIHGDTVRLKMMGVDKIDVCHTLPFLHSGTTPHHIKFVENLKDFPIVEEARKIRDTNEDKGGVNINFVEEINGEFFARTYERGVEDETLACGTGATSIAIALHHLGKTKDNSVKIKMPGGDLKIELEKTADGRYQNIWLEGPAVCVFKGEIN